MGDWVLQHEAGFRLTCFGVILSTMALWEFLAPRRSRMLSRFLRWPNNLALTVLNTVVLRLLFPVLAVEAARQIQDQGAGLLNQLSWSWPVKFVCALLVLDFVIYMQHVVFHFVPALWRLHRMHHTDIDLDVTSGARFHPIEIALSMVIKLTTIWWLGPDPVAVLFFEVILNGMAMFNHANIAFPLKVDRWLRWFFVTPDMHRVHHSTKPSELNSNFGFNLAIWDRLLGTYVAQPKDGHKKMMIGLNVFRTKKYSALHYLLLIPFLSVQKSTALKTSGKSQPS